MTDERRVRLHAEALRQMRWQQQRWLEVLSHTRPGPPVLASPADREWFHGCLDMHRDAGEEVPRSFYRRSSVIPKTREAGREVGSSSLNALVADLTRALAYFADDAFEQQGESGPPDE